MGIVSAAIAGAIVAFIVWLLKKRKTGIAWWALWLSGIAGALIGYQAAGLLGVESTSGVDWIRWALSVVAAFLVIWLARKLFKGGKK